ncbi:ABC transporter permease [Clostridium sp. 'White wine YQ']|uniref:ABC transporter permease n=1 Tax=Clostridium sp. 'White wine YQ' TaxID=3027474 RepID=UPI0023665828|nr:ABC transporter permease [Clostridium sp. 'White wine YQ']MDD7795293.1 ABC transporter permease [Clostridium sp. 'White wine YQ']
MKLFPHIKRNLLSYINTNKMTIIIAFFLFPMVMAYIYGIMEEDMFTGKSAFEPIKVEINYDKGSNEGEVLTSILKNKEVKDFINSDATDDFKCKVTISKDFNDVNIQKLKGSDSDTEMIKTFMKEFSESINQYKIIQTNVDKLNLSPMDKNQVTSKIITSLQKNSNTPAVKEKIVEGYRTLGSREYYTISLFSFTSIMLISLLIKGFYNERKKGILKRVFSTPNSKLDYFYGYVSFTAIMAFVINILYVTINRFLGTAFTGNYLCLLMIIFLQSILEATVIGAIIALVKSDKVANGVMTILIFLPMIFGGVFYSADIMEVKVLQVLSNFAPNSLILNAYKGLSITGSYSGALTQIVVMIGLSVCLLAISTIKVKTSWED